MLTALACSGLLRSQGSYNGNWTSAQRRRATTRTVCVARLHANEASEFRTMHGRCSAQPNDFQAKPSTPVRSSDANSSQRSRRVRRPSASQFLCCRRSIKKQKAGQATSPLDCERAVSAAASERRNDIFEQNCPAADSVRAETSRRRVLLANSLRLRFRHCSSWLSPLLMFARSLGQSRHCLLLLVELLRFLTSRIRKCAGG